MQLPFPLESLLLALDAPERVHQQRRAEKIDHTDASSLYVQFTTNKAKWRGEETIELFIDSGANSRTTRDGNTFTAQYKVVTPTSVWDCTDNVASNIHELKNGHVYKLQFSIDSVTLGENNVNNKYHSVIYTRLRSCSKTGYNSTTGTYDITGDLNEMIKSYTHFKILLKIQ